MKEPDPKVLPYIRVEPEEVRLLIAIAYALVNLTDLTDIDLGKVFGDACVTRKRLSNNSVQDFLQIQRERNGAYALNVVVGLARKVKKGIPDE